MSVAQPNLASHVKASLKCIRLVKPQSERDLRNPSELQPRIKPKKASNRPRHAIEPVFPRISSEKEVGMIPVKTRLNRRKLTVCIQVSETPRIKKRRKTVINLGKESPPRPMNLSPIVRERAHRNGNADDTLLTLITDIEV